MATSPSPAKARILVTGFLPFGGREENPSETVVRRLAAAPPAEAAVTTLVLPVEFAAASLPVAAALRTARFDAVLHLGLAANRDAPEFERFALNWRGGPLADEAGVRIDGEQVEPEGPAACMSTLPVDLLVAAVAAAGVPCRASAHAGTFLCNQTLYETLRTIDREDLPCRAGFLHLPEPGAPGGTSGDRPGADAIERAVRAAIRRIARLPRPRRRSSRTPRAPRALD